MVVLASKPPLRRMTPMARAKATKVASEDMPRGFRRGRGKTVDVGDGEGDGSVAVTFQEPTISEVVGQVEQELETVDAMEYDEDKPIEDHVEHTDIEETTNVSTDTQVKPNFADMIEDAPEDYQPERASAGRKREPSPFDDILPQIKGQGWKRVKHDGDVELDERGKVVDEGPAVKEIKRQLQKAQHWHKLGMDLNVTAEHVEFKVRELQKREKKSGDAVKVGAGQAALDENASADGVEADTDDRDE
jgi:hypothetical protein